MSPDAGQRLHDRTCQIGFADTCTNPHPSADSGLEPVVNGELALSSMVVGYSPSTSY